MDDNPHQPNSSHSKTSLPTFARSIPLEIAALPASTRTSFTRVDDTRPGTAAGDISNNHLPDDPVSGTGDGNGGGGREGADTRSAPTQPPEGEQEEEEVTGAVVPQVPQTLVQFLLVSGRRRSMAFDPETTVGRVKELVWNTWPNGTLSFTLAPHSPPTYTRTLRRAAPYGSQSVPRRAAAATRPDSILNFFIFIHSFCYSFYIEAPNFTKFGSCVCDFPYPLTDDRVAPTADWQDEHPPAPSHLRILYLGRILQDDETLTRM